MAQARTGEPLSDGRDTILKALLKQRMTHPPLPQLTLPARVPDPVATFIAKAKASAAEVDEISSPAEVPSRIAAILRDGGNPLEIHLSAKSPLNRLPWHTAPELKLSAAAPSGEQSAIGAADYGIAETGTVVFFSGPESLSSWHFRPGREFILLEKQRILPRLEEVILKLGAGMPATVNLVTGPSRTADIEQTIEMGAHGPRDVHILITG